MKYIIYDKETDERIGIIRRAENEEEAVDKAREKYWPRGEIYALPRKGLITDDLFEELKTWAEGEYPEWYEASEDANPGWAYDWVTANGKYELYNKVSKKDYQNAVKQFKKEVKESIEDYKLRMGYFDD